VTGTEKSAVDNWKKMM